MLNNRWFYIASYTTLGFVFLGLILLGWPGALVFQLCMPVLRWWFAEEPLQHLLPKTFGLMMFYLALLWPIGIFLGYVIGWHIVRLRHNAARAAVFVFVFLIWVIGASMLLYASARA